MREIVLMAGSQCAKTSPMLVALAWMVANAPAPALWITGNDDLAKDASQERITPTLERCPDCAELLLPGRLDKTTWKIRTRTCTIDIAGAQSSTALEQNPYKWVFGDEVRQWPEGSLQKVEKRQRSFTDAKRCFFSTPDLKGDEFHQRFMAGTQCEWVWPCMGCGQEMRLTWKELKYGADSDSGSAVATERQEDGAGASVVRIVCQSCSRPHGDTPAIRRHIIERGHWQAQNPAPSPGVVSYHWNALLPPWVRWQDLVDEWHRANEHKRHGNIEPLKVFICETLGEPWEDRIEAADWQQLTERKAGYVVGEAWPFEKRRFLTVDVQADVLYWTCRAWGLGGVSRLMDYGKMFGWDDLRAIQQRLGVKDGDTVVDSGFRTGEVYQQCLRFGWKPSKGVNQDYFTHTDAAGESVRRPWQLSKTDPQMGTTAQGMTAVPLVLICTDSIKDMLALFMSGRGPSWELPNDVSEEYIKQLAAEKATLDEKGKRVWKRVSRQNHWLDCEVANLTAAVIIGLAASSDKKP